MTASAITVPGFCSLMAVIDTPPFVPTVDTMNSSGRYTTNAAPSDSSMARGMFRAGSFTSPAMAATRSKPCSAMNVKPIAFNSPPAPCGKNGVR